MKRRSDDSNLDAMSSAFLAELPAVLRALSASDAESRSKAEKVVAIWESRNILDSAAITRLRAAMPPSAPAQVQPHHPTPMQPPPPPHGFGHPGMPIPPPPHMFGMVPHGFHPPPPPMMPHGVPPPMQSPLGFPPHLDPSTPLPDRF
jgi:hypothetical protein